MIRIFPNEYDSKNKNADTLVNLNPKFATLRGGTPQILSV